MTSDIGNPDGLGDPWNPGIGSQVPADLRHLSTIFRPENSCSGMEKARELRDLTGLGHSDLAAFRPQRLALHELLIRVTADLSVPDGSRIEDLGINFRRITSEILARYIEPRMDVITSTYDAMRGRLSESVDSELASAFPVSPVSAVSGLHSFSIAMLARFLRRPVDVMPPESDEARLVRLASDWDAKSRVADDGIQQAACRALAKVISALLVRHGSIWGSRDLVASLAVDIACNQFGSEEIGRVVASCVAEAAAAEGYTLLPRQERPVVMNTKGPSASGKSTLRPLQKRLASDIGVDWTEFALISPDIWRKQLLDYGSLGSAYKYGGAFTGEELQIIDQKLDRYMARKAERGDMTHLLIDRFRFDSFAPDSHEAGSNLLTRFGQVVYMFFIIAPPEMLVERAWKRGLAVGRYKAVDDTLAHSVEAYSGMPELFFTWIARTDKQVHFEFLDNSVPIGTRPRTVAFGHGRSLNILDVRCLLNIERFSRIDVNAAGPESLYGDGDFLAPELNTGFLVRCVDRIREINFADRATGRIYLHVVAGIPAWAEPSMLEQAAADSDMHAALLAVAPSALRGELPLPDRPTFVADGTTDPCLHTVGSWATCGRPVEDAAGQSDRSAQ